MSNPGGQVISMMLQAANLAGQLVGHAVIGAVHLADKAFGDDDGESRPQVYFRKLVSEQDLPMVVWISLDGERKKDEGVLWNDYYEDVRITENVATVDAGSGNFLVTRKVIGALRIWRHEEPSGEPEPTEAVEFDDACYVKCEVPWDDVLRFGVERSSTIELAADDMTYFRAGRLRYTEHDVIRAEFADHTSAFLSFCQASSGYNLEVSYALSSAFLADRGTARGRRRIELMQKRLRGDGGSSSTPTAAALPPPATQQAPVTPGAPPLKPRDFDPV